MTRELFIESIEALRKQHEQDVAASENLSKVFPDAFQANLMPKNNYVTSAMIKLLEVQSNDLENEISWIEYFVFDLEYGAKWKAGMIKDENNNNVDISDTGKLWDYLHRK